MTSAHRLARPGLVESTTMYLAVFLLAAGVPTQWFVVQAQGELNTGGELLPSLLFVGLAGILLLFMVGRWDTAITVIRREPLLLAFLGWAFVSVLWSHDIALSGRRVVAMLVTTYLAMHLVLRFRQFDILRMLGSVFVAVSALNLLWILAFPELSGPTAGQSRTDQFGFDERLTGVYQNANTLGRVMAISVFTMLAALKLDRRRRPVYLFGMAMAAAALALSQSKTSLVVAVLTGTLLVVFLVFRSRKQLFGAVVISVFGSAVLSVLLVIANLRVLTAALDRDVTLTGRIPLWRDVVTFIPDRPTAGHGFNGFWNGWGSPSHEVWNVHDWGPPHAHNQFIDVTIALGAVGLLIYIPLLIRTIARATRYIRDIPGVFGLWPLTYCCFWLLMNMTESGLVSRDITWFLLIATIVLVSDKKRSLPPPDTEDQAPLSVQFA